MGSWPSKVRKSSNKSVNPSSRSDKEECGEVNHNGTVNHQNHDRHLTSQDSTTPERQTAHPKTQLNQLACRGRKQCSIPFLHPFEILTDGSLNYAVFALLTYRPYLQLFNMVMDWSPVHALPVKRLPKLTNVTKSCFEWVLLRALLSIFLHCSCLRYFTDTQLFLVKSQN